MAHDLDAIFLIFLFGIWCHCHPILSENSRHNLTINAYMHYMGLFIQFEFNNYTIIFAFLAKPAISRVILTDCTYV